MSMQPRVPRDPTCGGILKPLCGGMGNEIPRSSSPDDVPWPSPDVVPVKPSPARNVAHFHHWAFDEWFGEGTNSPEQRIKLHNTEHDELIEALKADALREYDIVEYLSWVALELADNVWPAYGTAHSLGIPLDAVLDLLYKSLLTRVNDNGSPAVDENNKVRKTRHYQSPMPAIRELIERTIKERTART